MIEIEESKMVVTLTGEDALKFKELIRDAEADQLDYSDKEFAGDLRLKLGVDPHYSLGKYDW